MTVLQFPAVDTAISSYPSIYNIGHPATAELFNDPVVVEEKIDGSQFSFGVLNGELFARSKGKQIVLDAPEKLFVRAIEAITHLKPLLREGWIYRGEYLQKAKHNTLAYERFPDRHIILFDIQHGPESYLTPAERAFEAGRLGLEAVPVLDEGIFVATSEQLFGYLNRESVLGGAKIEGVVVKNYHRYGPDKKVLMGKYVSEAFKEAHRTAWKNSNPSQSDIVQKIIDTYKVEARWRKAVQHLRDAGQLTETPKDIGALMKEVGQDLLKEEEAAIKEMLWKYVWPKVQRGVTAGLPEWYKAELVRQAFEDS